MNRNNHIIVFILLALLSLPLLTTKYCQATESCLRPVRVVTTIFPLYDFVRQIGGHLVNISLVLPPGVEPHSFNPTPRDLVMINQADFFIYSGATLEPWVADVVAGSDNDRLVVLDASKGILPKLSHDHNHNHHHDHDNQHDTFDPHYWLDPGQAMRMVADISAGLLQFLPGNAIIVNNTKNYLAQLQAFDEKVRRSLLDCQLRTIVTGGHQSFGYFCARYGLTMVSAYQGFSPDARPSPRAIAELIKTVDKLHSPVIFHEKFLQPKVARIIAEETKTKLLLLHAVPNLSREEWDRGETYLSIMTGNLNRIKEGLLCR